MATHDLTLVIGNKNYSSWSLRAWLFLKHVGTPFEEIRVTLNTPGYRELIREHSPSGQVPVLKHRALIVWDSLAICEYLAETYPEAQGWPENAEARALARSVSAEMHSGFAALRETLPMNCRATGRQVRLSDTVAREVARIQLIWASCRRRYAERGPWLFGRFCIADAMYAPVVSRFMTYGIACQGIARDYLQTVWVDPAMREWVQAAKAESEIIDSEEVG